MLVVGSSIGNEQGRYMEKNGNMAYDLVTKCDYVVT